jgi:hypothetical protein
MRSEEERETHRRFVQALQHEHLTCNKPGCGGAMAIADHTPHSAASSPMKRLANVVTLLRKLPARRNTNLLGMWPPSP